MGTIVIRDPEYCAQFIGPHPSGQYGILRLSYGGTGVSIAQTGTTSNVTPEAVRDVLEELQNTLPLGIIGDYEILVTGRQLLAGDDPLAGYAEGVRAAGGWIALAGRIASDLRDVLAHEIAHELEHRFSDSDLEEFWRIVGQAPGGLTPWERSWKERLAEYLSAAIWGTPINRAILEYNDPDPTEETLARIREWALARLGGGARARVTIGEQPILELTIGSTTAVVNGREVQADVAPIIVNGRTLVPLRLIAEALGRRVDWEPKDGAAQKVYVY
ncbi:copper amine oxidase N-terminal domain-containing protein [Symbiobacterium terraclitae]|uniref:copper amine oxidase N-terminal domain-containing protein n=1 Tax=Symbiobacterium terraclitae TaxID=557451 RepID=UPI0035B51B6F